MNEKREEYIKLQRSRVDKALVQVMETLREKSPISLYEAMSYSLLAPGKRLRSMLAIASCEVLGRNSQGMDPILCALEMVHTYSLIQDDLPCMDNDDYRRGKPSCHKVFGEGIALLASDTLLTEAFGVLISLQGEDIQKISLIQEFVSALGSGGMVGGQVLDIQYIPSDVNFIYQIHQKKTGALFRAAIRMGAIFAQANTEELHILTEYAENLGLAFQMVDDWMDEEEVKLQKPSLAGLLSKEELQKMAQQLILQAKMPIRKLSKKMTTLDELADSILPGNWVDFSS